MGKKVRWFDAVQRILSTSEPDREEKEDKKAERPTSKLNFKKLWQFGKSSTSSSNSPSSAAPETAPAAHPQPPPPSPSRLDRQEAKSTGTASEQNDGRYHVATIASPVAVRTAEAVSCPTPNITPRGRSKEEVGAIRIQTACRGYLARREYRRARAQARLMSLLDGIAVRRQTEEALYCMQTMTRVQTQIYSRRVKTEEDKKALRSQIQIKQGLDKMKTGEGWDHSHQSKEQMEATLAMKQEAASRRQKALSYAFSRQWRNRNPASSSSGRAAPTQSSNPPMYMDPGCPNWGWCWSERWIAAARPWECQTAPQPDKDKDRAPATPKTPGRAAKPRVSISIQIPTTPTGRSPRLPGLPSPSTPTRPPSPSVLRKTITPPARLPSPRASPLHRSATLLSERPRSSQEHLGSGGMEAALRRTTSMRSGETPRRISVRARDADTGETGGAPVTPSYMQQTKSVKAKARCASPIAADRAELTVRVRPVSSPSVQRRMPLEFAEKPGASSSPRTPSNSKAKPEVRAKRPPSPRFLV
ncbi:protein IQ-DOMAIN 2 isoform X1 [Lolium perenne]|uniref:protein IQ-DOMAIN 2 isoform X1 n=1 Tax=Lolium perenne TaxID=4522 RepID=UPI0021F53CA2|nr:protein IQ-DOMAIN 3-like isoform X1 [Lolium perenne]XP_051206095.1 protein IQ-DOMAIN 3-like isoform X1 [Lolium perenne]XP_051206101.1 protein IQ-DOMAIN 3-like isoform X1 [Lolium perenne]